MARHYLQGTHCENHLFLRQPQEARSRPGCCTVQRLIKKGVAYLRDFPKRGIFISSAHTGISEYIGDIGGE